MTNSPSIDPPIELMREWSRFQGDTDPEALWFRIAREAAQWGADQELEAIMAELKALHLPSGYAHQILLSRRPKPPSLKKEALRALPTRLGKGFMAMIDDKRLDTIRRALEALPND